MWKRCNPLAQRAGGRRGRLIAPVLAGLLSAAHSADSNELPTSDDPIVSPATAAPSKFIDPQDGWFDLSGFFDSGHGFVPVVVPITEPAVGYGLGGALIHVRGNPSGPDGGPRRPNLATVGGLGTENGTWAVFAGDSRSWLDDRLHTLIGGVYGSIQLDYYGIGDSPLNDAPASYRLDPVGGVIRGRYRLGDSRAHLGLAYGFASIDVSFDDGSLPASIEASELESRVAGVIPAFVYDSRDNMFTPTRGFYAELASALCREWLGGTSDFERMNLTLIHHVPVGRRVFLGWRADAEFSFNDAPFYTRPYIGLRGAAALRYLGEHVADLELEARWQIWRRISLVGFTGAGIAWSGLEGIETEQKILTGGGGLRYELARRYGLHMGVDVAFGPDEPALYIQFGNAWFRP